MKKFRVLISRNYCYETEVEAETEEEAERIVNEEVDSFILHGSELYDDYNGSVIEIDDEPDYHDIEVDRRLEEEFDD